MAELTKHWRPLPHIRSKALGIVRRDDALLVCAVPRDDGTIKGWRPLGGSIELGERAAETVERELNEEIQAQAQVLHQIGVLENIYTHEGVPGHEIVFLFETMLIDDGLAAQDTFVVIEDNGTRHHAAWVPIARFASGTDVLFPDGLLALL